MRKKSLTEFNTGCKSEVPNKDFRVCSILENLRKSLEGTQSRKTFFEEYCHTFPRSDPCNLKTLHDVEVESNVPSSEDAGHGTTLPKPHGIITTYIIVAASEEEQQLYSIGECQVACTKHGEEVCSCPQGSVSIVVTKVYDLALTDDHIIDIEDIEFPLNESNGVRFMPIRGVQLNETLQYVLAC